VPFGPAQAPAAAKPASGENSRVNGRIRTDMSSGMTWPRCPGGNSTSRLGLELDELGRGLCTGEGLEWRASGLSGQCGKVRGSGDTRGDSGFHFQRGVGSISAALLLPRV